MKAIARLVTIAALLLGSLVLTPMAGADPALPPMTSTGSGPVIGGGGSASIAQQLFSFHDPNVQEVDGSDAAQFITAAAGVSNRDVATVFQPLQRALGCQPNGAGFGARAYRRADGQWGGATLRPMNSSTGLHRLFITEFGNEISWLLPVSLFVIVFGLAFGLTFLLPIF